MTALREAVAKQFPPTPVDAFYAEFEKRTGRVDDLCDVLGHDDAVACLNAALRAADAGESEGPWRVNKPMDPNSRHWFKTHWFVDSAEEVAGGGFYLPTEPEARAVCNALNRIALTGAGRGGI